MNDAAIATRPLSSDASGAVSAARVPTLSSGVEGSAPSAPSLRLQPVTSHPTAARAESRSEPEVLGHGDVMMKAVIDPKSEGIQSVIDENVIIDGNITSKGGLYLKGQVNGHVRVETGDNENGTVIIGETATVVGIVSAKRVIVQGKVRGGVIAKGMLDLAASAVLQGHTVYGKMRQAEGAEIDGTFKKIKGPDDVDFERMSAHLEGKS